MGELDRALGDIATLRAHLARSSEFRGFGPSSLAITGLLALAAAKAQPRGLADPAGHPTAFVVFWFATAALSVLLIGFEAVFRSRRAHGHLALPMLRTTIEHFSPAIVTGGMLTLVLLRAAPQAAWMLPGLWQLVFSLGAFAMARILPRPTFVVGVWYLVCGLTCLQLGQVDALSGWYMGVPFGVGQILVAAILYWRRADR